MRRRVFVAAELFEQLELLLPATSHVGLPTPGQFIERDLMAALAVFEERWEELPRLRGRDDFRTLIAVGVLVPAFSIQGIERADGSIELVRIRIDTTGLVDPDEPGDVEG